MLPYSGVVDFLFFLASSHFTHDAPLPPPLFVLSPDLHCLPSSLLWANLDQVKGENVYSGCLRRHQTSPTPISLSVLYASLCLVLRSNMLKNAATRKIKAKCRFRRSAQLVPETIRFLSHILIPFLPHFNQSHWQSRSVRWPVKRW